MTYRKKFSSDEIGYIISFQNKRRKTYAIFEPFERIIKIRVGSSIPYPSKSQFAITKLCTITTFKKQYKLGVGKLSAKFGISRSTTLKIGRLLRIENRHVPIDRTKRRKIAEAYYRGEYVKRIYRQFDISNRSLWQIVKPNRYKKHAKI